MIQGFSRHQVCVNWARMCAPRDKDRVKLRHFCISSRDRMQADALLLLFFRFISSNPSRLRGVEPSHKLL